MWRRKESWKSKKNYEVRCRKRLEKATNGNQTAEQRSLEQRLTLWKNRPLRALEEIPHKAFQILQEQHRIGEDDS